MHLASPVTNVFFYTFSLRIVSFSVLCFLLRFTVSHFIQEVTRALETYRQSGVSFVEKPIFFYWLFFELSSGYKLYFWALFFSHGTLCLYLWQDCNSALQLYIPLNQGLQLWFLCFLMNLNFVIHNIIYYLILFSHFKVDPHIKIVYCILQICISFVNYKPLKQLQV